MLADLPFALRQLRKQPGFTAVAVGTLAVCLGANLTIFALIDAVLLRALPFPESERLVTIYSVFPRAGVDRAGTSLQNYFERRDQIGAFARLAVVRHGPLVVGETGATEQRNAARVSPEFFETLGVKPALGRAFTEVELSARADDAVIVSDQFWRQHFDADPRILERQLRVNGTQRAIVGVLPPAFRYPAPVDLFLPLAPAPDDHSVRQRFSNMDYEMIGRLRPGVTLAQAQAEILRHDAALAPEYPDAAMIAETGFRTIVAGLQDDYTRSLRPILLLLQAGVLLLLLIGGVNLMNLLLVRASDRARELAIRQALGASRRRLLQQVFTEVLVLCAAGGVAGWLAAANGLRWIAVFAGNHLPVGAPIVLDERLALTAVLAVVGFGMLLALPLGWFHLRGMPQQVLHRESRGGTAGHGIQRLRHGFIVAQIALAFVLLAGAAALGLSLHRAMSVSPGFRPDHVLTGRLALPNRQYPDWPSRLEFVDRLMADLQRQPGVTAAGIINRVPFSGEVSKTAFSIHGRVRAAGESLRAHYFFGVGGEIFPALGIALHEGRVLEPGDAGRRVCVVDTDFARAYWPTGSALGQRLYMGANEMAEDEAMTVIGVVGAVKQSDLTREQTPGAVYVPIQYRTATTFFAVVRTGQSPDTFGRTLQQAVRALDPEMPVHDVRSMDVRVAESLVARRSPTVLTGLFALAALGLAAVGTYGVLAYAVAQRRREIGVRLALGAQRSQIGRQFLTMGLKLVAWGSLVGLLGAMAALQAMRSFLFGVAPVPLAALAGTAAVMLMVATIACLLPIARASRVDPIEALRHE
jgi:predicted permease